jgi:hypothetical protein
MSRTIEPSSVQTPKSLETRTVPVKAAFREIGCGKTAGYEAIRAGKFPLPVIAVGRKFYVARADLDRLLGRQDGAR